MVGILLVGTVISVNPCVILMSKVCAAIVINPGIQNDTLKKTTQTNGNGYL